MRKFNIFAISVAMLLLAAASCTTENLQVEDGCFISLNLSSKSPDTKATKNGEDPFNENIVNSVYYFFYQNGETSENPVLKGRLVGLGHKKGVRTEDVPVSSAIVDALFAASDTCQVFIVANPPKDIETFLNANQTLEALRAKLIQTTLDGTQESFTMVFDDKACMTASTGSIMTVEAKLRRLANKFTVSLVISDKVYVPEEWKSVPADAKVELHNMFKETSLDGDFDRSKSGDSKFKEKYFNTKAVDFGDPVVSGTDKWKCNTEKPVYSYSMSWDFVGALEPYLLIEMPWKEVATGKVQLTYYKVFLNTKRFSTNNWYQLDIDLDRLGGFQKDNPVQIFKNMKYLILDWNDAFEDGEVTTTDIDGARYLMMNQVEYWLYNQETWNFPYTSSHECVIVDETYEKDNYRSRSAAKITGDSPDLGSEYSCTLDGSLITFYHALNNDINATHKENGISVGSYDMVPYTFKFTIRHKDDVNYSQEVIVHQYPAIYIEAQPNSKGVEVRAGSTVRTTSFLNINRSLVDNSYMQMGYQYYKYSGYGGDPYELFQDSSGKFGNSNGNMYVVTTSNAPDLTIEGKPYMLADPRKFETQSYTHFSETNMLAEDGAYDGLYDPTYTGGLFLTEPALYEDPGTGRSLAYYYPAKDTRDAENLIAPKLRIASSWGQCTYMCYEKAVRRCAAYQEDGYPAGRWRMPTAAEVMYIVKLSSDHMIPMLFGQFSDADDALVTYWCSTGVIGVYNAEKSDGTLIDTYDVPQYQPDPSLATERTAVRCVYDEWYWENRDYDNGTVATTKGRLPEYLWGTRYWGDMPR